MMNRYITALLIVLAATGVEAQTYKSALKLALTDISYEEFIQQPEIKALENDILSAIKAIKAEEDAKEPNKLFPYAISAQEINAATPLPCILKSHNNITNEEFITCKNVCKNIVIRGPNCY